MKRHCLFLILKADRKDLGVSELAGCFEKKWLEGGKEAPRGGTRVKTSWVPFKGMMRLIWFTVLQSCFKAFDSC